MLQNRVVTRYSTERSLPLCIQTCTGDLYPFYWCLGRADVAKHTLVRPLFATCKTPGTGTGSASLERGTGIFPLTLDSGLVTDPPASAHELLEVRGKPLFLECCTTHTLRSQLVSDPHPSGVKLFWRHQYPLARPLVLEAVLC